MSVSKLDLQEQLRDLNESIRSGVLMTRDSDGKQSQYRTLAEMKEARRDLQDDLDAIENKPRRKRGISLRVCRGVY